MHHNLCVKRNLLLPDFLVILAQAEIHNPLILPDYRLRRNDVAVKIQAFDEVAK